MPLFEHDALSSKSDYYIQVAAVTNGNMQGSWSDTLKIPKPTKFKASTNWQSIEGTGTKNFGPSDWRVPNEQKLPLITGSPEYKENVF